MTSAENLFVLTVTQLTNAIKHCLESSFKSVWLQGEVSNSKLQSSGHFYFSLKDSYAQVSAVMFRQDTCNLKSLPKDGNQVIIRGEMNIYPPSGKYQMIVREIRLMGLGELLVKFEELKRNLREKGWFDQERKKSLPKFPKRIGVVTSPTGAVIQDILHVLSRRYSSFHLILNPVKVQGEGAALEIAKAIEQFNAHQLVDVLIVGRGGGSIEDLWAFNEEIVAKAIYESRIPIISAVGHETDQCIADYVADVRAPTPSAAAEIATAEKAQLLKFLEEAKKRAAASLAHLIKQNHHRLDVIRRHPLFASPYYLLSNPMQRVDDMRNILDNKFLSVIAHQKFVLAEKQKQLQSLRPISQILFFKDKLSKLQESLTQAVMKNIQKQKVLMQDRTASIDRLMKMKVTYHRELFFKKDQSLQLYNAWAKQHTQRREKFNHIVSILRSIDPKSLLTKGYCILFSEKKDSVISSVQAVQKDQKLSIILADGEIISTVTKVIPS